MRTVIYFYKLFLFTFLILFLACSSPHSSSNIYDNETTENITQTSSESTNTSDDNSENVTAPSDNTTLTVDITHCTSEKNCIDQFQTYLNTVDSCENSNQCAIIFPGCPLSCFSYVNLNNKEEAESVANQLIQNSGKQGCILSCASLPKAPICIANQCVGDPDNEIPFPSDF